MGSNIDPAIPERGRPLNSRFVEVRAEGLDEDTERRLNRQASRAHRQITAYLGLENAQGVRVTVVEDLSNPRANADDLEVLLPMSRIEGISRGSPGIKGRGPAIVHELTHVLAPSNGFSSRLMDEGLAVFMEEKFGSSDSYPNMGRDLHQEAAAFKFRYALDVPDLDGLEDARKKASSEDVRRAAYLLEGSFVRYLVENYGLTAFLEYYRGVVSSVAFGEELAEIELKWNSFLQSTYRALPEADGGSIGSKFWRQDDQHG